MKTFKKYNHYAFGIRLPTDFSRSKINLLLFDSKYIEAFTQGKKENNLYTYLI